MKSVPTTFLLILFVFAGLTAFSQPVRAPRTGTSTTIPQTRPAATAPSRPPTAPMAIPIPSEVSGIYSQDWTLQDGTKVTSKFTIQKGVVAVPVNPSIQERKIKVEDRNAQPGSEEGWDCVTKETRVSLSNNNYMTVDNLAQSAHIYPGAIYRFSNYVNGSWLDETGDRNPIILSTQTRGIEGDPNVTVYQPDVNTIRAGINELTNRFASNPANMSNGAFKMEATEVLSLADANLKMGASGFGFGASASYLFNFQSSEKKKVLLVDCTQELFILDTQVPAGGFFTSQGSLANDMMYVGSVTYGVRVLASIETVISSREVAHQFDAAYNGLVAGGSVNLDAYMRELGAHTTVKMYVVGGPSQGVYPAFNQAELTQVIQGIFRNGTYGTAQPIKYTFQNMKGELVLSQSLTDYFISRSCTPKAPVESRPDRIYTTKLWNVSRGTDDDWELYGQIWTQVFDAQGNEIGSRYGNDRLLAINEENHLSAEEGMGGYSPGLEVSFRLPATIQPGAVMLVWYWLNDYDSGSGNDFLSMRNGSQIRYNQNGNNYFCRLIYLDELAPGTQNSQKTFEDTFTDSDGDSFTSVTGSVTCVVGQ